ncbi:MAG: transcription-repair coupling factor [Gammaproteobacteria bacterium]|nr:transcription-repair coupling factor [Gammaproteobacteria bacterium]
MPNANPLTPPLPLKAGQKLIWGNLHGASIGLALSQAIATCKMPVVIIAPDSLTATRLEYELNFFHHGQSIIHFPDWETLPYDPFSPHQDIISERLSALSRMPSLQDGAIITPISTLMQRLPPREYLEGSTFLLKTGQKFDLQAARKRLDNAGYRFVDQVREHGEFAVRGSIIDLFPMGSDTPYRIDLFDDEIDSIRTFSPDNQRTMEKVDKIELLPAQEFPLTDESIERFRQTWRQTFPGNPLNSPIYQDVTEGICPPGIEYYFPLFFQETATFFDYLPPHCLIIQVGEIYKKSEEFWQEIETRYEQRRYDITRPLLEPKKLFIPAADVFGRIKAYHQVKIQAEADATETHSYDFSTTVPLTFSVDHKATKPLHALENFLMGYDGRVLFCAETTGRREVLLQLFKTIQLNPKAYTTWDEFLTDDASIGITVAPLDDGLSLLAPPITLIAEAQLYGKRVMQRRRRKVSVQDTDAIIRDLAELQVGSPIVHIDHGIGRYLGLQTLTVGEQIAEYLTLAYADEAKLYVPVSSLHLISRYSGTDPEQAPIHRLGTEQWQKAKHKAAEQVRDVAAELLNIYAHREARVGVACEPVDSQYAVFAAAFPFEETPDQQQAIDQVIKDMLSEKPMDRLVCGDVGFGKTEVAMRAAFMAVQNNKQVVVLVPTTLLAQQHYQNFQDRFSEWPFHIAPMSRFNSSKEQQRVIDQLAEGKVDIVIGTHKLLQEDIKFKSLGLVIIDEEHRFGVRQKERLKALRSEVDILTLTATPIPRTLNMAFAGIRDLSLIATPPMRRLSIKTFVHEFQDALNKEAISREIMRGGQVYFLHNDVASIEKIARDLEKLVPEARVGIAHGQMRERELEQVMADFYHRRFNLLVCTTIIESGIDVPSANTIIINRADKFGLAQLHQLRGRVGRSHHQAYAYLLTPPEKKLTSDAKKRLDAITSLEDLGVGFTLATHDLEIRGAGELLGEGQSGNMQAIGFSLYMDLLSRAVDALKSGKEPELDTALSRGTEIDLQLTALIPAVYLDDVHLRLQFYKRIAMSKTASELDEIQVEMIDRFGLLPEPLKNLFAITELKQSAEVLGISKVEANSKGGKIEFIDKPNIDPMKIIKLIQSQSKRFRLDGPARLRFTLDEHDPKDRILLVKDVIHLLEN